MAYIDDVDHRSDDSNALNYIVSLFLKCILASNTNLPSHLSASATLFK